jgi:hypothetical protein
LANGSTRYKGRRGYERRMRSYQENETTAMLNMRGMSSFRYDIKEIMTHYKVDETVSSSIIASVTAKGSRISIDSAVAFVRDQEKAGVYPKEASDEICNLLYRHTRHR